MNKEEIILICQIASCASAKKFNALPNIFLSLDKQNTKPDKIYEVILQMYLFNGFPCTIESLKVFIEYYPHFSPNNEQYNVNLFEKRGIINCKEVYRANFDKLQENIYNLSPDLSEWMIIEGYGKVLGRSILTLQERELINVAMLCTNMAEHQLYSHIKGSFNTGSDYQIIKEVILSTDEFNVEKNITKSLDLLETIHNVI